METKPPSIMYKEVKNIQIDGKFYTKDDLEITCKDKIQNSNIELWEKDIYLTIQDWFSSKKFITIETSGSTGSPKKTHLQKKHMIASAEATLSFFNLKKGDNIWLCLPTKYIAGKMIIVRALIGNLNLLYTQPESAPKIDSAKKINFAAMVPNQVFELLQSSDGIKQLQNVDNLLIGGATITNELENSLLTTSNIVAWHSYGMTETITHIAIRKVSDKVKLNAYKLLPNIKVRTNNNSQLIIDAPLIGVNNLKTNDIATIQADGSFIILGRFDSTIISGGIKLHPESIENKINQYISQSFFIAGIPDDKLGKKLVLFIEGNNPNSSQLLITKLQTSLKKYETPKTIIYLNKFLRTETGKLKRNHMTDNYIESK